VFPLEVFLEEKNRKNFRKIGKKNIRKRLKKKSSDFFGNFDNFFSVNILVHLRQIIRFSHFLKKYFRHFCRKNDSILPYFFEICFGNLFEYFFTNSFVKFFTIFHRDLDFYILVDVMSFHLFDLNFTTFSKSWSRTIIENKCFFFAKF